MRTDVIVPMVAVLALSACSPDPEIYGLAVVGQDFVAGIAMGAHDANSDLHGGRMHIDFGGRVADMPIEFIEGGQETRDTVVSVAYPMSACQAGDEVAVAVWIEDGEGNASNTLLSTVEVDGLAYNELEPNSVTAPDSVRYEGESFGICAELHRTGVTNNNVYLEEDNFAVTSQSAEHFTISLAAPLGSDFDLWLDDGSVSEVLRSEDAVSYAGSKWLTVEHDAAAGRQFWITVAAGSGPEGEYSLYVE